jgi:hypothetical protein
VKRSSLSAHYEAFPMPSSSVYIGIDLACAVRKRLPICMVSAGPPLTPLTIPKHLAGHIPRGVGNKEVAVAAPFREAARGVVSAIHRIVGDGRLNGSPLMLPPHRLRRVPGHRRPNSEVVGCPRFQHPLRPPGQAYARNVKFIWTMAAKRQIFPMPTKSGCSSASSFSRP